MINGVTEEAAADDGFDADQGVGASSTFFEGTKGTEGDDGTDGAVVGGVGAEAAVDGVKASGAKEDVGCGVADEDIAFGIARGVDAGEPCEGEIFDAKPLVAKGARGKGVGDRGEDGIDAPESVIKTLPDNVPWVVNNVEVTSITGIHGVCPTSPIHSVRSEGGDANYPRGG